MFNPGIKNRNLSECIRLATAGCDSVVELGCGFGNRLQGLDAATRIGVDAHAPYIAEARRRYPDMADDFLVREAGEYIRQFIGKGFFWDAVLMVDFLEHLTPEAAAALIADCKRVARRIILWVPLGKHPQARDPYEMGGDHWQTHRSTWEPADLEALGFHVKEWPTGTNDPTKEPRAAFCVWHMSLYNHEYWEKAARRNPFDAVRTGWSEADFDTRTDETNCHALAFKPDDVVLDYGCGPGYACKLVAPKAGRYVGLDYSNEMLNIARRRCGKLSNASFVMGDGISIPFPDAYFDCIFCELVFQHMVRATTLGILNEMLRVLKPTGRAALQFPTRFYGKDIGFTVEELGAILPGWRLTESEHYIVCLLRP